MNENLNKVLNKIIEEENLAKEFCQLDNMDEMYKYCYELGEGYTEEEFDEDIAEMINALQIEGEKTELSDKDLDYIAGGVNISGMVSKTTAIVLSALTIGSVMPTTNAMAAGAFQSTGDTQSISSKLKSEISDKWSKTKQALSNLWKNHKGMVIGFTVAAAAVAGGVVIAKHHKTVAERQRQRAEEVAAERQRAEEVAAARRRSREINAEIQKKEKQISALETKCESLQADIRAQQKVKANNVDGSGARKQRALVGLKEEKRAKDDEITRLRGEMTRLTSELDVLPK